MMWGIKLCRIERAERSLVDRGSQPSFFVVRGIHVVRLSSLDNLIAKVFCM